MRGLCAIALALALVPFGARAQEAESSPWSGFYGGLAASGMNDSEALSDGGTPAGTIALDGSGMGAFLGYRRQSGGLILGGEVAFAPLLAEDPTGANAFQREDYIDLKGQVGYSMGQAVLYGVLGYSIAASRLDPSSSSESGDGMHYGLGLDYRLSDRATLGAEYLDRNLSTGYGGSGFPDLSGNGDARSLTVRLSMSF